MVILHNRFCLSSVNIKTTRISSSNLQYLTLVIYIVGSLELHLFQHCRTGFGNIMDSSCVSKRFHFGLMKIAGASSTVNHCADIKSIQQRVVIDLAIFQ